MSPIAALREARPQDAAPRRGTDSRAEQELRAILGEEYRPARTGTARSGGRLLLAVNVAVVAVLLAAVTVAVIALGPAHPRPAAPTGTPTTSPTSSPSPTAAARLFTIPDDFFENVKVEPRPVSGQTFTVGIAANGCITLGDSYLMAPKGSTLQGEELQLGGIGSVKIGSALQSATGEPVDWLGTAGPDLRGTFTCGIGQYFKLDGAYVPRTAGASRTTLTGTATYSRTATPLPGCDLNDLTVWGTSDVGGASQTLYQAIYVQNTGAPCTLEKTPLQVNVDGAHAVLNIPKNQGGSTLPTGAAAFLNLSQGCGQGENGPKYPITLSLDGQTKSVGQSFPFTPVVNCNPLHLDLQSYAAGGLKPDTNDPSALKQATVTGLAGTSYAGGPLDYTVTISNHGSTPFDVKGSPSFVEIATTSTADLVQTGLLDGSAGPIPPGGSRRFTVHSDAPPTAGAIEFFLAGGPGTSTDG